MENIKTEPSKQLQVVDLVRALAILLVLAGHLKPTLPLPGENFRWGWDHFQKMSSEGVYVFFVISGYLITRIIDLGLGGVVKPDWKSFYTHRIARIAPLFLLQVFLGLIIIFLFSDGSKKFVYCFKLPDPSQAIPFWISLFTFSFNWASAIFSKTWNGIGNHWSLFWSLSIEEQFYLFYPLILKWIGTIKGITVFLISVVVISTVGQWILPYWFPDISFQFIVYTGAYGQIATGALLYLTTRYYGDYLSENKRLSFLVMVTGLLIVALIFLDIWSGFPNYLIAVGIFLFLLGGIHLPFFQSKVLKPFSLPGKYSYGNYLLHIMVLFVIHSLLWNLNIIVAFLIFVIVSSTIAAFSYHFFELPTNRLIRKCFARKVNA